ncbi:MAG: hypothetical protein QM639_09540, partial [Rhodocyclaceae bacterium]
SIALRRQLHGRLPAALAASNERILAALEAGRTVADVPPELTPLYRPSVQPYLISWFRHDPLAVMARLDLPCLIVQGDTDIQIGPADARALAAANPRCQQRLIAGMNHVLKQVPDESARQIASYGDPTLPLDPTLADVVQAFIWHASASAGGTRP